MAAVIQPFSIFGTSFGTFLLFLVFFFAMYGIMMGTGMFGDNKGIQFIVSFVVALVFASSANAILFLFGSLRSVVIIFVVIFLLFLVFGFMGVKMSDLTAPGELFAKKGVVHMVVMVVLVIILLSNWRPVADNSGDGGSSVAGTSGGGSASWSGARAVQIITSTGFIAVLGFLLLFMFLVNSLVGKMGGG